MGKGTYCIAGALCLPPSNFAGRIENDAFPLTGPRLSTSEPAVPACEDSVKPGSMAQHSRVDLLLRAPITVTLRVLKFGAVAVAATAAVLVRRAVRSLNETILWVYLNVCGVVGVVGESKVKEDDEQGLRSIYPAKLCTKSLVRHSVLLLRESWSDTRAVLFCKASFDRLSWAIDIP